MKPSSSGGGLIVDDDVVLLQSLGYLRAGAVAHVHQHLMGFGVADGGIAQHVETRLMEGLGKVLGVVNDGLLIAVLEVVHLIGRHQQTQLGTQMVVGDTAGEGTGLDGLPQPPLQILPAIVDADDAPLGAEEGLVGGAGDDLSALPQRASGSGHPPDPVRGPCHT